MNRKIEELIKGRSLFAYICQMRAYIFNPMLMRTINGQFCGMFAYAIFLKNADLRAIRMLRKISR